LLLVLLLALSFPFRRVAVADIEPPVSPPPLTAFARSEGMAALAASGGVTLVEGAAIGFTTCPYVFICRSRCASSRSDWMACRSAMFEPDQVECVSRNRPRSRAARPTSALSRVKERARTRTRTRAAFFVFVFVFFLALARVAVVRAGASVSAGGDTTALRGSFRATVCLERAAAGVFFFVDGGTRRLPPPFFLLDGMAVAGKGGGSANQAIGESGDRGIGGSGIEDRLVRVRTSSVQPKSDRQGRRRCLSIQSRWEGNPDFAQRVHVETVLPAAQQQQLPTDTRHVPSTGGTPRAGLRLAQSR